MNASLPVINGYEIIEKIKIGTKSQVYRARKKSDGLSVVIKLLNNEFSTFNELLGFQNQYTLTKNLQVEGIVQPLALELHQNHQALIMEDTDSIDLQQYLNSKALNLTVFFSLALALGNILEGLRNNRIIHKDIKPQNILINPKTKQVHLIDFSIASEIPREDQSLSNVNSLAGTLAYLSPEQTGRMNRGVDYRTDFYSLGVTFYEMLTGQLPFQTNDPMEQVHCHIAKIPTPPKDINNHIPQTVNDIILKLMAKNAEERYQSAAGLCHDLTVCQKQWQEQQHIGLFTLGLRDFSKSFSIPEKLYGRISEVTELMAAFDRVKEGDAEIVLVTGDTGIGKSALVNEIHKPIVRDRGYFIKGKYEQFNHNIPFSALVQAIKGLVLQLLTEDNAQVEVWKKQIILALDGNGQILIEVIPDLESIIGPQPPVQVLRSEASMNRFARLFHSFLKVFTQVGHPLVIFLDDLQWIDSASLDLIIKLMIPGKSQHLLLIGAYSDNDFKSSDHKNEHPFFKTLYEIEKSGSKFHQITLNPLSITDLNHLIADSCHCSQSHAMTLAKIVRQKTTGNPYSSHQFLRLLHQEKLLVFDNDKGFWQCDFKGAKQLAASHDVVEYMVNKILKLSIKTQQMLQLAACIGQQFDLFTIGLISESTLVDSAACLWEAIQEELCLPIDEGYKFFQNTGEITSTQEVSAHYRFVHDQVQKAAYSLISKDQKAATHLKIGRLLKRFYTNKDTDEHLFERVNQLNLGRTLIIDQNERYELAQLNLKAGNKAKTATAYIAAQRYFTCGISILEKNSWQSYYKLTLALYECEAETAYLLGHYDELQQYLKEIFAHSQQLIDSIKSHRLQIKRYVAQSQFLDAIRYALPIFKQLGLVFPENPDEDDIQHEFEETQSALANISIKSLIDSPSMSDEKSLAAIRLMIDLAASAYIALPKLYPLLAMKTVQSLVHHGYSSHAIALYGAYGFQLQNMGYDDEANQFSDLALSMLERQNDKEQVAQTYTLVYACIKPWNELIRENLPAFMEGYDSALEVGDQFHAATCAYYYCSHSFFSGKQLATLEAEITSLSLSVKEMHIENMFDYICMVQQALLNLLGRSKRDISCLQGVAYKELEKLPKHQQVSDGYAMVNLHILKLVLCYLFQHNNKALEMAQIVEQYIAGTPGVMEVAIFHFYDSLVQLAVFTEQTQEQQDNILKKVAANQKKMSDWALHAPMNYQHKWDLVHAEQKRISNDYITAMEYYERAILGAKDNGYVQEMALANELTARFFLNWKKDKIAKMYMRDAYHAYAQWGARAKVDDLEQRYSSLLPSVLNLAQTASDTTHFTSTTQSNNSLDLNTVMKSNQILSGELSLKGLLRKMLGILMENAGAQRSVLLLNDENRWSIAGESNMDDTMQLVLPDIPMEDYHELPKLLVQHVINKQQYFVLDDARDRYQRFHQDPYFKNKPMLKSVLCLPIHAHSKLAGLLYLENTLLVGAFPNDRLEMVQMLAAQAAISLENAVLYENMEEKIRERTVQLNEKNKRIQDSLIYASHVQKAFLPSKKIMEKCFEQHFVIWLPRDVVGGDIYFCKRFQDGCVVTVIDCTGHGVPGAMMAMVAGSAFTSIQLERYLNNPAGILKSVNQFVTQTLQLGFEGVKSDNGMDMGVCCISHSSNTLTYAGAKFSLFVAAREGVKEIKGDRKSIGYKNSNINFTFTNKPLPLLPDVAYYLCSDGFIDQAGGVNRNAFGRTRFKKLLLEQFQKPFYQQRKKYLDALFQHQDEVPRYDDVTVLGFSLAPSLQTLNRSRKKK